MQGDISLQEWFTQVKFHGKWAKNSFSSFLYLTFETFNSRFLSSLIIATLMANKLQFHPLMAKRQLTGKLVQILEILLTLARRFPLEHLFPTRFGGSSWISDTSMDRRLSIDASETDRPLNDQYISDNNGTQCLSKWDLLPTTSPGQLLPRVTPSKSSGSGPAKICFWSHYTPFSRSVYF